MDESESITHDETAHFYEQSPLAPKLLWSKTQLVESNRVIASATAKTNTRTLTSLHFLIIVSPSEDYWILSFQQP